MMNENLPCTPSPRCPRDLALAKIECRSPLALVGENESRPPALLSDLHLECHFIIYFIVLLHITYHGLPRHSNAIFIVDYSSDLNRGSIAFLHIARTVVVGVDGVAIIKPNHYYK